MKEFEVRFLSIGDVQLFRVVRAANEQTVIWFFRDLMFRNIYVQEVPLSNNYSLEIN